MVTPFRPEDESIDFDALKLLTNYLIKNGVHGIIPGGSSGEMIALTRAEQKKVNAMVCEYAEGRVKVYPSTGAYRTRDVVELSRDAEKAGADGVMIVTPWYMGPNEDELYRHYATVREAINIPIMIYHNPYYSTVLMTDEFMARLYNDGIINSVKERQADQYRQQNLRALTDDNFGIFYGFDITPYESLTSWADGWVCGTGNLFPKENSQLYELIKAGKLEEAKKHHFEKIRPYFPLFFEKTEKGFPTPWLSIIKEGLAQRGINVGVARKPVLELPPDVREKLEKTLRLYNYL